MMDGLERLKLVDSLEEQAELIEDFVVNYYKSSNSLVIAESRAVALMHEATEVSELLYKSNLYRKHLDVSHLMQELGDVLYNVQAIANAMGFAIADCIEASNVSVRSKMS